MLTSRIHMAHVQDGSSKVGLERILTPISSLAGWVMVVAGVLSSVQVELIRLTAVLLCMLHAPGHQRSLHVIRLHPHKQPRQVCDSLHKLV